ncbi:MAG: sigma-70 family RNA polymerase sigma factor [Thermoguttaceae bacterium]|jgi:RNA polymerase sigma-70 factor (ECF subfamily)|nr:sigma-70 family RNA polymerase sigma factor [Thermoguttaceae bacterium]
MDDPDRTRQSLVARLRDPHDAEAWAEFVEIYSPLVYGTLRRRGLQDADAADVAQEVLRTVFRSMNEFQTRGRTGAFRAWLACIVRTRLADHADRRKRQTVGSGDTACQELLEDQPARDDDEELLEQEYRKCLFQWAAKQVRGEFHDSTWQAFWQTYVEGKESRHVAAALGMSVEAVYMARSRVLARLKKKTAEVEG